MTDFLFLCEHKIVRSRREQIMDPFDLMCALEQLKIVGSDNLHLLSSTLTEIHRQDLTQKVEEHCQRHGIRHFRDEIPQPISNIETGQVTSSFISRLVPDNWPSSSNEVASFRAARVLEPDDASCHMSATEHSGQQQSHNFHHSDVPLAVLQSQNEGIRHEFGDDLISRGTPASIDLPCYAMDRRPRGNVCTTVF